MNSNRIIFQFSHKREDAETLYWKLSGRVLMRDDSKVTLYTLIKADVLLVSVQSSRKLCLQPQSDDNPHKLSLSATSRSYANHEEEQKEKTTSSRNCN